MRPINRILVPTDFSSRATRALAYAARLAQVAEAQLTILHAYQAPQPTVVGHYPTNVAYLDTLVDPAPVRAKAQQQLETLVQGHLLNKRLPYTLRLLNSPPEEAIQAVTHEQSIDLIVMGLRGGGTWSKLMGSTTTRVMRREGCPILAVPENAVFSPVKHLLLATDYERIRNADTFRILVTLANILGAQIDLLHVTTGSAQLSPKILMVGDMIDRLLRHARHTYHQIISYDILDGLRTYLDEHDKAVGMLAMIPRDHSPWERIARGSVTKTMLFEADRPVLIIRG